MLMYALYPSAIKHLFSEAIKQFRSYQVLFFDAGSGTTVKVWDMGFVTSVLAFSTEVTSTWTNET